MDRTRQMEPSLAPASLLAFAARGSSAGPLGARTLQCVRKVWYNMSMICDICGQRGVRERRVTRSYGKGEHLLVIENIPVMSCPHCGESYMTAETLQEIERIKLHRQSFAIERPVPVAAFE
jgi:YgiT-type zinc finger domain-containing protein